MAYKHDVTYFKERLKDLSLLESAVKVAVGRDRFLCVPCGGDRVMGFTHFFKSRTEANIVYRTLEDSGGNFPYLRVEPITNAFEDEMFIVRWGLDEPDPRFFTPWEFEIVKGKQLGYSDECMPAHRQRYIKFYGSMYE